MDKLNRESFQICEKLYQLEEMGYDVTRILTDALSDCLVEDREHYKIEGKGGSRDKEKESR